MGIFVWFGGLVLVGVVLFFAAPRVRPPIVVALLAFGVAIFAVRLHHAGPYPFPHGLDLGAAVASIAAGLLLWRFGRRSALLARLVFAATPVLVFASLVAIGHEAEEVVVLRTHDAQGAVLETRLWVVDYDGAPWIVTTPLGQHVRNLTAEPRVELMRHGETRCFVARRFEDRVTIEAAFHARERKYWTQRIGEAAGLWAAPGGDLQKIAVAIRLDPCP